MSLQRPRVVLAVPRALDCAGLSALLRGPHCELVSSHVDLPTAVAACKKREVDALIVDVAFPRQAAFEEGKALRKSGAVATVAFLDTEIAMGRALSALSVSRSIYLTRNVSIEELFQAIRTVLDPPEDLVDLRPSSLPWIESAQRPMNGHESKSAGLAVAPRHHFTRVDQLHDHDRFGILRLSKRERQVIKLLAGGKTVKQAGELMGLAHSTVDNHKSRLMKKLQIHRLGQVIRIAVEAGILD
jgi:two-component system, NarL family, response regulator NreC